MRTRIALAAAVAATSTIGILTSLTELAGAATPSTHAPARQGTQASLDTDFPSIGSLSTRYLNYRQPGADIVELASGDVLGHVAASSRPLVKQALGSTTLAANKGNKSNNSKGKSKNTSKSKGHKTSRRATRAEVTRYLQAQAVSKYLQAQAAQAAAQEAAAQQAAAQAAAQAAQQAAAQQAAAEQAAAANSSSVSAWQRVATCEEGGSDNATYGYYGITPGTWAAYGGTAYAPTAGGASQGEQVAIANKINGGAVPDAGGCSSW